MKLDPYTLVTISPFLTAVMGLILLIIARKDYPHNIRKSMQLWGIAYLILTVGCWLSTGIKVLIPDFLSNILGSTLEIWSLAEVYYALRVFDGKPSRWWYSYSIAGMVFLAGWVLLASPAMFTQYIGIKSFLAAALLAVCGTGLVKAPVGKPSISRLVLGSIFWLQALFPIQRILSILSGQAISDANWQTLVFGALAIGGLLTSFGFLLVCNERLKEELLSLAITDELTGLYNRRKIEQSTNRAIWQAQKSQQPLTLLLFDADDFKTINDTYGHLAGDKALQVIAEIMERNLRSGELVGRLGGDEFVILLANTPHADGQRVAERLVSEVGKVKVVFEGNEIQLGISYGIAVFSSGESNFTNLVRLADKSLYKMKRNHRRTDLIAEGYTN